MSQPSPSPTPDAGRRNLAAVAWTSLLTDISSEMVLNVLPLYLSGVLGVRTSVIGLIEGCAEALASLLKVFAGSLSDRLGRRKGLAVAGYGLSAFSKIFFLVAESWPAVAAVRWADRVGKGVRTAPRDALLAESVGADRRGFAFGLHRAADTLGAAIGIGGALLVIFLVQGQAASLGAPAFRALALAAIAPGLAGVLVLALVAREAPLPVGRPAGKAPALFSRATWRALGKPFLRFLAIAALFDLGNSSDAFLVLRASERGVGVLAVLSMLLVFNLVYAASALPAGRISDRFGRRGVLIAGWSLYALLYLGFARAESRHDVFTLFAAYGVYYGLTLGSAKALVADLVPAELRGTAFGLFAAVLAIGDLPASVIAGVLWQGAFGFPGYGPAAPFYFGAATAALASLLLLASRLGRRAARAPWASSGLGAVLQPGPLQAMVAPGGGADFVAIYLHRRVVHEEMIEAEHRQPGGPGVEPALAGQIVGVAEAWGEGMEEARVMRCVEVADHEIGLLGEDLRAHLR